MTSDSQARQPSKRFAKLDAIPRHKRASGIKAAIARVYIARRATTALITAAAITIGAGTYLIRENVPSDPLEIAVAEISKPAESMIPTEIAAAVDAAKIQRIGDELREAAATDRKPPDVGLPAGTPLDSLSGFARPEEAAKPPEQSVSAGWTPVTQKADVRKIIPVAEGLDLYRSVEPATQEVIEVEPVTPPADDFSLPTKGVPTEKDMAGFIGQSGPTAGDIQIIPPEEDLSPTIALPEIVPVPIARPAPTLAKGTKVEFHIVQGQGVKSGFWLGNKEDPNTRRFFVVVSPQLENGDVTHWKFTNIADGSPADTDRMAVEVTEDAFVALAQESKEFGKVRNPVLGRGTIGDRNIKWRIASIGGNLIAGWDRETSK